MQYRNLMLSILTLTIGINATAGVTTRSTKLTGFQETPAILSSGQAMLKTFVDESAMTVDYVLTFSGLSSNVTAAHIHFGQPGVAGGIMAYLCGGGGTAPCPLNGGTIIGKITQADLQGVPAQGINAGDFNDFLAALNSGNAYANIHTILHPSGEIRGQLRRKILPL